MAANTFSAQVSKWVTVTKTEANAIFRESAERLIEQAQTPRGEGGNMPIDTGFLRASGQASLGGMPFGQSTQAEWTSAGYLDYTFVISKAKIGDTIWYGWTAEYAKYMEFRYGFMRLAAQNWNSIVNQVAREFV